MLEQLDRLSRHVQAAAALLPAGKVKKGDAAVDAMAEAAAAWEALMRAFDLTMKSQRARSQMGKVARGEEPEKESDDGRREGVERRTPLAILEGEMRAEAVVSQATRDLVDDLRSLPEEDACERLHDHLVAQERHVRLMTIRAMIRYQWHEARNPWEFMKRGLAITRRYIRHLIVGITETEVSQLLGETRQATSAREIRVHDKLLIGWGVIAPKAADGGLKSAGHCAKAALAAKGNQNRKNGRKLRLHKKS